MKNEKVRYEEELVAEIRADYAARAQARQPLEAQWQLNADFVQGNQYCYVTAGGEVEEGEKEYFWQEREVFNHVASIMETRLAKLSSVRPHFIVRPASGDDKDVKTAKAATKILESATDSLDLDASLTRATMWSELTGTAFYKLTWDKTAGKTVGYVKTKPVREGDVRIDVCSPYEIYPDSLARQSLEECRSLMHVKAVDVEELYRVWGKRVEPEPLTLFAGEKAGFFGGNGLVSASPRQVKTESVNCACVIERYDKPTAEHPEGRLTIVAGNVLLHDGALPYQNGKNGRRDFPFIRQTSISCAGNFFGTSMVERCIPIQRAYNAVKNRKHEFLNRISMGVLAVEDGSLDTAELCEEGLSPGKVLVYRQGSNPPTLLDPGSVPSDFDSEESKLLAEFIDVSGISELMRSSTVPSSITSGTAIQMLIEQDDTRINLTARELRSGIRKICEQILRLYRQFADRPRLSRFVGEEGDVELIAWKKSDLTCDDVVFETENEIGSSVASKRNTMLELLRAGLLYDKDGKLTDGMKRKILEVFGYGGWEQTQVVRSLHATRAARENLAVSERALAVSEIDDHDIHEEEHVKYMLSSEFSEAKAARADLEEKLMEHVREHRKFAQMQKEASQDEGSTAVG